MLLAKDVVLSRTPSSHKTAGAMLAAFPVPSPFLHSVIGTSSARLFYLHKNVFICSKVFDPFQNIVNNTLTHNVITIFAAI